MSLDRLDEDRVETALIRLSESDITEPEMAELVDLANHQLEAAYAQAYLKATGSVEERKQKATLDADYGNAVLHWANVKAEHKKIRNQREHETEIILVWRSLEATRRKV